MKKLLQKGIAYVVCLCCMVLLYGSSASAATQSAATGYTTSADGLAWTVIVPNPIPYRSLTTPVSAQSSRWISGTAYGGHGTEVYTSHDKTMYQKFANLKDITVNGVVTKGVHTYEYTREHGINELQKWVCQKTIAGCIHYTKGVEGADYEPSQFHGIPLGSGIACMGQYWSAWFPYCADCGRVIGYSDGLGMYHYLPREAVDTITELDTRQDYYYHCPYEDCGTLEQGSPYCEHTCVQISVNRYEIQYHTPGTLEGEHAIANSKVLFKLPNDPAYDEIGLNPLSYEGQDASGYADKLVDIENGQVIDGRQINLINKKNADGTYSKFYGWALTPEKAAAGQRDFINGADITDNLAANNGEIVHLYAVWRDGSASADDADKIIVNANGGKYIDNALPSTVLKVAGSTDEAPKFSVGYNAKYNIDSAKLVPPSGATVHFNSNGGSAVPDMSAPMSFVSFTYPKEKKNFANKGSVLEFTSHSEGKVYEVKANYVADGITLPNATKPNAVLNGWYTDPSLSESSRVGGPGDTYKPTGDVTLYAKWGALQLIATANYVANGGRGAIDLNWYWNPAIGTPQFYKPYISAANNKDVMSMVGNSVTGVGVTTNIGTVTKSADGTYTIPSSGYYEVSAFGASGGTYGTYAGGKGGSVSGAYGAGGGGVTAKSGKKS